MLDAPLAIDLCCGSGGWTDGFLRMGYRVVGYDVKKHRRYMGNFVCADVRSLIGSELGCARIIVASPPCTEFSHAQRLNGGRPAHPDLSIVEACFRIARDARAPLVLENVWGLQDYIGPAAHHYGKFFLWGSGVPALLPKGPRWKDRQKQVHRSPMLRARVPDELADAVAAFWLYRSTNGLTRA